MSSIELAANKIVSLNPLFQEIPIEFIYLGLMLLSASLLLGLLIAPIAGFSTYIERRIAGRIQSRIGCNRVGPEGVLQFLADGIKLLLKEDNMPKGADAPLFKLAPFLVVMGAFMSFACVPFGKYLVVANINVGILYLISISSFAVVGILLAGWSSNNKWSLLGAMRSAAQIVSYEIPLGLALMVPVLLSGSLGLQDLNTAQAGGMRNWFIFAAFPGPFIAFFVYFISALAEVNRTPFDLPEAESELVSGYNTEYSGIRWGMFFVAEYANMFLVSAISVTAFFGGWQPSRSNIVVSTMALFFTFLILVKTVDYLSKVIPGLLQGKKLFSLLSNFRPMRMNKVGWIAILCASIAGAGVLQLFADFWPVILITFIAKCYFFMFIIMWIRWVLPRYRVDQLMDLCWKKLIPIGFACLLWTAFLSLFGGWSGLF